MPGGTESRRGVAFRLTSFAQRPKRARRHAVRRRAFRLTPFAQRPAGFTSFAQRPAGLTPFSRRPDERRLPELPDRTRRMVDSHCCGHPQPHRSSLWARGRSTCRRRPALIVQPSDPAAAERRAVVNGGRCDVEPHVRRTPMIDLSDPEHAPSCCGLCAGIQPEQILVPRRECPEKRHEVDDRIPAAELERRMASHLLSVRGAEARIL